MQISLKCLQKYIQRIYFWNIEHFPPKFGKKNSHHCFYSMPYCLGQPIRQLDFFFLSLSREPMEGSRPVAGPSSGLAAVSPLPHPPHSCHVCRYRRKWVIWELSGRMTFGSYSDTVTQQSPYSVGSTGLPVNGAESQSTCKQANVDSASHHIWKP